jgi:hypothetical protein
LADFAGTIFMVGGKIKQENKNRNTLLRPEVSAMVSMKNTVFWDVKP